MGFMDDLKKLTKPYTEDDDDFDEFDDDARPSRPSRSSSAPSPRIAAASIWTAMSFPRPAAALPPAAGHSEAITPPVRRAARS